MNGPDRTNLSAPEGRTQQMPSFVPLLEWLEHHKIVTPGTVAQVNQLADHVKGFDNALKSAGIIK